jgi:hypothetical protein
MLLSLSDAADKIYCSYHPSYLIPFVLHFTLKKITQSGISTVLFQVLKATTLLCQTEQGSH